MTVVIVRDDLLERVPKNLPPMLDYKLQAANDSLYNTPPVFGIYVLMLVARWLKNDVGGLAKMAEINREKAGLLYDVLDRHPDFYRGHARADSRSMMNVTWRLPNEDLEKAFLKEATAKNLVDLKGHRSVGGVPRFDLQRHAPRRRDGASRSHARVSEAPCLVGGGSFDTFTADAANRGHARQAESIALA